jgi:hypothetical protein
MELTHKSKKIGGKGVQEQQTRLPSSVLRGIFGPLPFQAPLRGNIASPELAYPFGHEPDQTQSFLLEYAACGCASGVYLKVINA